MLCGPSQIITLPIGVPLFEEWDGGRQLTVRWRAATALRKWRDEIQSGEQQWMRQSRLRRRSQSHENPNSATYCEEGMLNPVSFIPRQLPPSPMCLCVF